MRSIDKEEGGRFVRLPVLVRAEDNGVIFFFFLFFFGYLKEEILDSNFYI